MRTHLKRRLAAAVVLPVLLATGACGGGSEEPESSSESTTDSTSSSEETETETESEEPEAAEGESVEPAEFTADMSEGMESLTTARTSMTVEGQTGMSMEGVVDYTGDSPAMEATMEAAGMPEGGMEMILLDGIMYMSAPGQGGKYMRLDLNDPNSPLAQMGLGGLSEQLDMRKAMESYSAGLTGVTYLGEEDVEGESLEHYEIEFDPSKVDSLKQLPPSAAEQMTYDAWFDDDHVMRQMVMEMPQGLGTMTMKIYDLGTEVDIQAPPKSQVMEMPSS
ncbi:hypothetical protein DDE18_15140 [Nocardioides gansuensis]|uniref:LppX_LprAFG lipoprotein n=1 Tax=Nocardioides gansuensis TaxID=2138300 RepID=A0A2T8F8K6_9ACTN|nr:LppX_LprAFG lipoprotein [Nocardioides gansuensis]PVG82020.1 hypothetical protein DDE18_15140 [Nocardioides gansuensis]